MNMRKLLRMQDKKPDMGNMYGMLNNMDDRREGWGRRGETIVKENNG